MVLRDVRFSRLGLSVSIFPLIINIFLILSLISMLYKRYRALLY